MDAILCIQQQWSQLGLNLFVFPFFCTTSFFVPVEVGNLTGPKEKKGRSPGCSIQAGWWGLGLGDRTSVDPLHCWSLTIRKFIVSNVCFRTIGDFPVIAKGVSGPIILQQKTFPYLCIVSVWYVWPSSRGMVAPKRAPLVLCNLYYFVMCRSGTIDDSWRVEIVSYLINKWDKLWDIPLTQDWYIVCKTPQDWLALNHHIS